MANELIFNGNLALNNGKLVRAVNLGSQRITQAAAFAYSNTQSLTTAEETIAVGADIATLGVAVLNNLDSTNNIEWGPDNSGTMLGAGILKPGEAFPLRLKPGVTYKAKASAGTAKLDVTIFND